MACPARGFLATRCGLSSARWLPPPHAQSYRCSLKILQQPSLARTSSRMGPHCSPETPQANTTAASPSSSGLFKLKIKGGLSSSSFQDAASSPIFQSPGKMCPRFHFLPKLLWPRVLRPGLGSQCTLREHRAQLPGRGQYPERSQGRAPCVTTGPTGRPALRLCRCLPSIRQGLGRCCWKRQLRQVRLAPRPTDLRGFPVFGDR